MPELLVELIATLRGIGWRLLFLMGLAALSVTVLVCTAVSISGDAKQQAAKLREVQANQL